MPTSLLRWRDLGALLDSLNALHSRPVLSLLLLSACGTGVGLSWAEQALAGDRGGAALLYFLLALSLLLTGLNAAGWWLAREMRADARLDGLRWTDALHEGVRLLPRQLAVWLRLLLPWLPVPLAVLALLWAARLAWVGPVLLAFTTPLAVLAAAAAAWALLVVVGPLAGPALWSGATVGEAVAQLRRITRQRLIEATLLKLALLGLVAGLTAVLSAALLAGARALALLGWLAELQVPPQQVLAHLFGHTLRALGQAGAPVVANSQAAALSLGGGVLVALLLVLPTAVYLRGCCAIYRSLSDAAPDNAAPWTSSSR